MFNFAKNIASKIFGFQSSELDLLSSSLKQVAKRVRKQDGGCVGVCVNFSKFLESHDLFKDLNLIAQKEAPYPKVEIMCAALMLLNAFRGDTFDAKDKDLVFNLAKYSFINSGLMLDDNELENIFLGSPDDMFAKREAVKQKSQEAWDMWEGADPDVLLRLLPN
jgi:hypothetical protein